MPCYKGPGWGAKVSENGMWLDLGEFQAKFGRESMAPSLENSGAGWFHARLNCTGEVVEFSHL
jgi:hypothetical protein